MEKDRGIRQVAEVGGDLRSLHACVGGRRIDLEEFHEREECHQYEIIPLARLVRSRPGRDVSEALTWDDLTGMRPKADQKIEAREKEVKYVLDMGRGDQNPEKDGASPWMDDNQNAVDRHQQRR